VFDGSIFKTPIQLGEKTIKQYDDGIVKEWNIEF